MPSNVVVHIALCAEHGLHGERDECFVCGGPVEQVPMIYAEQLERAEGRVAALERAVEAYSEQLEAAKDRVAELERAIRAHREHVTMRSMMLGGSMDRDLWASLARPVADAQPDLTETERGSTMETSIANEEEDHDAQEE